MEEPRIALALQNLSVRYENAPDNALTDVSLTIPAKSMVMVMGAGGSGKSTLANVLNGLVPHFINAAVSGTVVVECANPLENSVSVMADRIGLVFQDFETQLFSTRVNLEVAFGMENRGVERSVMVQRVAQILRTIGLEGYEERSPVSLSGGQKQRLAIGAVLATSPSILCLDEPTTDLDPVGKAALFDLLQELRAKGNAFDLGADGGAETIVVIEHETEEALFADRIVLMNKGRIAADGAPADILLNVELFEKLGVMPLQTCDYFHKLGLMQGNSPLGLDEAQQHFVQSRLRIDIDRMKSLAETDEQKTCSYGAEIIRVEALGYSYDHREVLQGIDLCVREREFVALLGSNGSGKTTLAKHFNGLLRPGRGKVLLNGCDTTANTLFDMGQVVGYVFQNPDQQIFCDTVFEEVAYGLKLRGLTEEEMLLRVSEALQAVGLAGCEGEDPFSLSKGQRQRVAVASILAIKPKVLVLDEPTTGLDYKDQRQMMELVKKLNQAGHTIVMITHTMWVVAEYAHRVILLDAGNVLADGNTREIFSEEKVLARAAVKPPLITRLGNRLGCPALSVDELMFCTRLSGVGQ